MEGGEGEDWGWGRLSQQSSILIRALGGGGCEGGGGGEMRVSLCFCKRPGLLRDGAL